MLNLLCAPHTASWTSIQTDFYNGIMEWATQNIYKKKPKLFLISVHSLYSQMKTDIKTTKIILVFVSLLLSMRIATEFQKIKKPHRKK